jgi:hypothetical protein
MPAEAGIQVREVSWIPGRASYRQLARNDDRSCCRSLSQETSSLRTFSVSKHHFSKLLEFAICYSVATDGFELES